MKMKDEFDSVAWGLVILGVVLLLVLGAIGVIAISTHDDNALTMEEVDRLRESGCRVYTEQYRQRTVWMTDCPSETEQ